MVEKFWKNDKDNLSVSSTDADYWLSAKTTYVLAIVLILVGSLSALHTIQWHELNAIYDDTLTTYANLMRYPERFENDNISILGIGSTWGTIINWGSGILWRDFDIAPHHSYVVLAIIQAILVGLGPFALTYQITKNPYLALFSIPFVYIARPTQWNLAEFTSRFPQVYPGDFAIYLVILAFVFLLQQRRWLVIAILFLSGLFHPSIALYACAIIGLYWFWDLIAKKDMSTIFNIGLLICVGLSIVIPRLIVSAQAQGTIPDDVIMREIDRNFHFNPYHAYLDGSAQFILFVYWMILATLSTYFWKSFSQSVRQLLIAALIAVGILFTSQYIGNIFDIVPLIQLIGGRTSQLLSLLLLPMILNYGWELIQTKDWRIILPVTVYILLFAEFTWTPDHTAYKGQFIILSFVFIEFALGRFMVIEFDPNPTIDMMRKILLGLAVIVALLDIFLLVQDGNWIRPTTMGVFLLLILVVILHIYPRIRQKVPNLNQTLAVVCLIFFTFFAYRNIYTWVTRLAQPEIQALHAAQSWARDNTAEDAMFAGTVLNWRVRAERPYLIMTNVQRLVYFLDERLYTTYLSLQAWGDLEPDIIHAYDKSEETYLALREVAPIDYLIFETRHADKDFETVYQNDYYIIYKLPDDDS